MSTKARVRERPRAYATADRSAKVSVMPKEIQRESWTEAHSDAVTEQQTVGTKVPAKQEK